MNRFVDPLTRLWRFADVILMRCPRCDQRATVVPAPGRRHPLGGRLTVG